MAADESTLQKAFLSLTETVKPDESKIAAALDDYRKAHPTWSKDELAEKWADRVCWLYASEGAVSALPGAIPGLGTGVQIAVEAGAISADLVYMIRCMAGMVGGVAMVYERDIRSYFNDEFIKVLGMWCGVLLPVGEATVRIASKVAIAQFKRVPGEVFKKINRRVGTTILTKYGTKRGGIAVGRLIPFGVGAIVGGGFNLATMKGFKVASMKYFKSETELAMAE
ncbi:MAG TPA: hypothetical protein PKW95_23940 [bacterium]|nr:hypothetical protein [bacterium]